MVWQFIFNVNSNFILHSACNMVGAIYFAGVAQLVRARPCQGRGCGFETHYPLKYKILMEMRVRAPQELGSVIV